MPGTIRKKMYVSQSRKWCFPTKFVMRKETDEMYREEFKEIFEILFRAAEIDQTEFPEWKKLQFCQPCGYGDIQKCLGLSRACKVKRFFVIVVHLPQMTATNRTKALQFV